MKDDFDFIKGLYDEGLVEKQLDEDAWADIRARRVGRLTKERSVALYGYLVGIENAQRAKIFVDTAEQHKAVQATFVNAYSPIIAMIDEIVEAGPSYIAMLKNLHKRAKSNL